jgi:hypothetical protein
MSHDATLVRLLEAWQDDGLPEADEAALRQLLRDDSGLRRAFAEQVAMLGAVRAAADQAPRWLALFDLLEDAGSAEGAAIISFDDATMKRIAPSRARAWHELPAVRALAAAVAILLAGSFFLKLATQKDIITSVAVPAPAVIPPVAVIVGSSAEANQVAGTYLKPGTISQDSGWLTLQTLSGVSVTLDAPFRAELISNSRIRLNEGRARVRVPSGAEGFKLESPTFDVVDLGTEFAAKVNADGTGTCRVFEGKADVSLLDSIGEVKRTHRLTANKSVRVNAASQDMRMIEEANGDYPEIKQPQRPLLALPPSYAANVMAMGPAGYWRFDEIVSKSVTNEVEGGPRLQAAGTAAIAIESGGNHSGALTRLEQMEFFKIPYLNAPLLEGDFSFSLFAQFEWLQNFVVISATRYDNEVQGDSFTLQSYASFRGSGLNGTGLHAVLRDPPAWEGGSEVYGNTLLRPRYWHQIAVTRKADRLTLYLDGTPVGSRSMESIPLNYREIFVGRLNGNAQQSRKEARGLVGHIDELAIFTRALTNEEIRKLGANQQ